MKNTKRCWFFVWLLALVQVAPAQEDPATSPLREQALVPAALAAPRIVGPLDDGTPVPAVPKPTLPPAEITTQLVFREGNHMLTVERVRPSADTVRSLRARLAAVQAASQAAAGAPPVDAADPVGQDPQVSGEVPRRMFLVPLSVEVYDHRVSVVRWWQQGEGGGSTATQASRPAVAGNAGQDPEQEAGPPGEYEVVSNIDWNVFCGVTAIEAGDCDYAFIVSLGNTDTGTPTAAGPAAVPDHPPLPADGPGFVVSKGDATNAGALAFMRAMHEVYRTDSQRLLEAYASRERNRMEQEAWLKAHPPQPKNETLRYTTWTEPTAAAAPARQPEAGNPP